jgi:hypothetical protein
MTTPQQATLIATEITLAFFREKAAAGNSEYSKALSDFEKQIADPNHQISSPLLSQYNLVDVKNRVHNCIVQAYKNVNPPSYKQVKLDQLQEKATSGDMKYALALADYEEQLKDPTYVVDWPSSVSILKEYGLYKETPAKKPASYGGRGCPTGPSA